MSGSRSYVVSLLEDDASIWPAVQDLLPGWARVESGSSSASKIGLLGWTNAGQDEIASLPELRGQHDGPLVAILAEMPSARGARVIAARLEGAVLTSDIEQTLLPRSRRSPPG